MFERKDAMRAAPWSGRRRHAGSGAAVSLGIGRDATCSRVCRTRFDFAPGTLCVRGGLPCVEARAIDATESLHCRKLTNAWVRMRPRGE